MSPGFRIVEPASLRQRNTFGVDARAPRLVEVSDSGALPAVFREGHADADSLVLGGGSNLLFAGDAAAPLVTLTARGHGVVGGHDDGVVVQADAGMPWHPFVMWTLAQGLSGLQNLALIPGSVGAAPIQNIGAYGVEVGDCIHSVTVFDRRTGAFQQLGRHDCAFAYRDSAFKRDPDRHIVTAVEFLLSRTPGVHTGYAGLGEELAAMGIDDPTPGQVADAVIRIRTRKLPDPAVVGNAGSFFKNPIVPATVAEALASRHPALPVFRGDGDHSRKLSAAWLIDQCGWKGHRDGDAGVSDRHALVLVNHGAATGAQLLALARRIAASVRERFGIGIEPEPRIVGAAW